MSNDRTTRTPAGLRARGRAFWRRTVDTFDLSEVERELLRECCRLLDECERLREAVEADGTMTTGSAGQPRVHPALGDLRQHRLALAKLLAQLSLPDEDGQALPTSLQARARKGANVRWRHHREVMSTPADEGSHGTA